MTSESAAPHGQPVLAMHAMVFVAGAAILALELVASRVMAPMFGASLYIWGAILSVTLVCLAVGYAWGGKLADSGPAPGRSLVRFLLIAAAWIGISPIFSYPVATLGLAAGTYLGPIVVTLGLFAAPLTLLATATPLAFGHLQAGSPTHSARVVGNLFAVGTLGSVAGALAASYLVIPWLGPRWTFVAIAMLLVCATLPWVWRGEAVRTGILVVTALALSQLIPDDRLSRPAFNEGMTLIAREASRYGDIAVVDSSDGSRFLLLDGTSQNRVNGPRLDQSLFSYIPFVTGLTARFPGHEKRALIIGLGAGTLARNLADIGYAVDIVEINPAMQTMASRYFQFPAEDFGVYIEDARSFLNRAATEGQRYGLVVVDATAGGHRPAHLYNRDAFSLMQAVLSDNGVLVTNQILHVMAGRDQVAQHTAASLADLFRSVEAYDLDPDISGEEITNLVLVASDQTPRSSKTPEGIAVKQFVFDQDRRPLTDHWNPGEIWSGSVGWEWRNNIRQWLGDAAVIPI